MFPAFLITIREGIEAALIIAIIIAYLTKIERNDMKRYVWAGVALAFIASIALGAVLLSMHTTLSGVNEKLFEGSVSMLATVILTSMILWMAKNSRNIKKNLYKKIDASLAKKYAAGIIIISFVIVFREGLETVLFLSALYGMDSIGTISGFIIGLASAVILAYLLLKGSVRLPSQKFFKYTAVLLIIFAAGIFGYGIHEFIEAMEEMGYDTGIAAYKPYNINPPDPTSPFHEKGVIGSILKTLVGYDGDPELLRIVGYIGYWIVIGYAFLRISRSNKDEFDI